MRRRHGRFVVTAMLLATACTHNRPTTFNHASGTGGSDSIEVRAVRQLWKSYVDSKQGRFAGNASTPSPLWSSTEQHRWRLYDLAASYIPDGAAVRVLDIRSTGVTHEYEIVSEFQASGLASEVAGSTVRTFVYATLENGRWVPPARSLDKLRGGHERRSRGSTTSSNPDSSSMSPRRRRRRPSSIRSPMPWKCRGSIRASTTSLHASTTHSPRSA